MIMLVIDMVAARRVMPKGLASLKEVTTIGKFSPDVRKPECNKCKLETVFRAKKKENCRTILFNQTVTYRGCVPKVIRNRFCFGYCNSFVVPSYPFDLKAVRACSNNRTFYKIIKLSCPRRRRKFKLKKVLIVKSCSCSLRRSSSW